MLQNEFETLTGITVSPEEYKDIERVYLLSNFDKFEFAKMWKSTKNEARAYMIDMTVQASAEVAELKEKLEDSKNKVSKIQNIILNTYAAEPDNDTLAKVCEECIGKGRPFIKAKLNKHIPLTKEEQDFLVSIL